MIVVVAVVRTTTAVAKKTKLGFLITGVTLRGIILSYPFSTTLAIILSNVWLEDFMICIRLSNIACMSANIVATC